MQQEIRAKHSHNTKTRGPTSPHRPHPSPPARDIARENFACGRCGRVAVDVALCAIASVTSYVERRLCRHCIAILRADALTVVEELEAA